MISKKTVETVYEYDDNEKLVRKTVTETIEYKEEPNYITGYVNTPLPLVDDTITGTVNL